MAEIDFTTFLATVRPQLAPLRAGGRRGRWRDRRC
jgi:hypothetical protein